MNEVDSFYVKFVSDLITLLTDDEIEIKNIRQEYILSRKEVLLPVFNVIGIEDTKVLNSQMNYLRKLIPTVFYSKNVETGIDANLILKINLKLNGINYTISSRKKFVFKSSVFVPIVFFIQWLHILIAVNSGNKDYKSITSVSEAFRNIEFKNYKNIELISNSEWLIKELGNNYSQGMLIDFIDKLYDRYKHTKIEIEKFRLVFQSFGVHCEDISNTAFDIYIKKRDTLNAWSDAIKDYFIIKLNLEKNFASLIVKELLN